MTRSLALGWVRWTLAVTAIVGCGISGAGGGGERVGRSLEAVTVLTVAALTAAIAAATPGTDIALADGMYAGPIAIDNVSGTAAQPIVIHAMSQGAAIVSGTAGITVTGSSYVTI